ncbi:alpha/beta hydrolase [Sphingomonas daechungensis]|uniref:lipase family alpha/beta hydrolase n=1 Tax=Sphingomonas daechungensis TaxID=1176646 RepID=UPI0031E6C106
MSWRKAPAPIGPAAGNELAHPDDLAPPVWHRMREMAWRLPRVLAGLGPLGPRGPEDGPPALVIPGFLATDRTTMDLRRALARAGWRVHPWLLGLNTGAKKDTLKLLEKRLNEIGKGKPVLVVGWSLGGMFARQLAHRCPKKVRAVVTLGSPFSGNLKTNTNVREFYERIAGHDVNEPPFPHVLDKPPVPTLALWSRRDGIVAPSAARGLDHERDKAVEIDSYHTGFAVHRPVLMQIVNEIRTFLAEAEGWPPTLQPLVVAAPFAKA